MTNQIHRFAHKGLLGAAAHLAGAARGRALLFAVVVLASAGTTSSAYGASISLSVSPDPAEDRATTLTASGVADKSSGITIKIRPAGGAGCAATRIAEPGTRVVYGVPFGGRTVAAGQYAESALWTVEDPGTYLLCGYLEASDEPDLVTSLEFVVRSNVASVAIDPLALVLPGQPVILTFRGATEVRRVLDVTVKPAGGAACGTSRATDTGATLGGGTLGAGAPVEGAYVVQHTQSFETGDYLICAWVQENSRDLNPEAVTSAAISVRPLVNATKLEVARAQVLRSRRQLDVLAPISANASGAVKVQFQAAGRTSRFTVPVDASRRRVLFKRGLTRSQAKLGTGILTLAYDGDADTQPQEVRLRAASQRASLDAGRPVIDAGHLRASGKISSRARGVVRLQLLYQPLGANTVTHEYTARISNGRYSFNVALPPDVLAGIAARRGVVHSYTLFTGYLPRRMRGEMESYQVMASP